MGRSVGTPKKHIVSCRIDQREMDALQTIANKSGVSISTLLRNSLDLLRSSNIARARV